MQAHPSIRSLWLAVALAGCGDDGSGDGELASTGEPSSSSTTEPAPSTGPVPTSSSDDAMGSSTTADASTSAIGDTTDSTGDTAEPPPGDPVTIAVGYGGMRVRSLDDGQTWQDYVQLAPGGGDDMELLRGAAWGEGRFVAVGWRIFSSPDGEQWTVVDAGFGTPWAAIDGGQIVPRDESAPADFATKRLRGGSPIERAEPGTEDFAPVFDVPDGNNVFQAYRFAFAEGWVGP